MMSSSLNDSWKTRNLFVQMMSAFLDSGRDLRQIRQKRLDERTDGSLSKQFLSKAETLLSKNWAYNAIGDISFLVSALNKDAIRARWW